MRSLLVLSATTNIRGGAQSIKGFCDVEKCRELAFVSEVKQRSSRYLEISSSCLVYLRMKEILFFAFRFVVTYLCPVRSRRRDCSLAPGSVLGGKEKKIGVGEKKHGRAKRAERYYGDWKVWRSLETCL